MLQLSLMLHRGPLLLQLSLMLSRSYCCCSCRPRCPAVLLLQLSLMLPRSPLLLQLSLMAEESSSPLAAVSLNRVMLPRSSLLLQLSPCCPAVSCCSCR